jgi:hypothetical protein
MAGHRGSRRGVHWGQLALSVPAGRKAILSPRGGAIASFGRGYVLEGDCAFDVFAGEHGGVFPLYAYPDIRRGHGREDERHGLRLCKQLIWCGGQAAWRLLATTHRRLHGYKVQLRPGEDGGSGVA